MTSTTFRDARPCRSDAGALAALEQLGQLVDQAPEELVCPRCGWAVGAHGGES